jgi:hypothetical protein
MEKYDFVSSCFGYDEIIKRAEASCFKIPVEHKFFVAREDIEFVTSSGKQYAKPGDYVIIGKDHAWPVSPKYFAEHYHELPE